MPMPALYPRLIKSESDSFVSVPSWGGGAGNWALAQDSPGDFNGQAGRKATMISEQYPIILNIHFFNYKSGWAFFFDNSDLGLS